MIFKALLLLLSSFAFIHNVDSEIAKIDCSQRMWTTSREDEWRCSMVSKVIICSSSIKDCSEGTKDGTYSGGDWAFYNSSEIGEEYHPGTGGHQWSINGTGWDCRCC